MPKYPVFIADYKGYQRIPTADENSPGAADYIVVDKKAICWVSEALYEAMGQDAFVFESEPSTETTTLNEIPKSSQKTGTYHGKTCYIETDQETPVPDNATYKKRYQIQLPNDCPIYFLQQFANTINADSQSPLNNKITKVYVRGGKRYPVLRTTPP